MNYEKLKEAKNKLSHLDVIKEKGVITRSKYRWVTAGE